MININLLAWREELRKREGRFFLTMLSFFILSTLVICGFVYLYSSYRANSLGPDKELLTQAAQAADKQIAALAKYGPMEEALKKNTQLLQAISYNRLLPLYLLNKIAEALPKSVYLDRIEMKDFQLAMEGRAQTNQDISQFIDTLQKSSEFNAPVLKEAKTITDNDTSYIEFEIDAKVMPAKPLPENKNAKP